MINKEKLTAYGLLGIITTTSGLIGGGLTALIMTRSNRKNKKLIADNEYNNRKLKDDMQALIEKYKDDFAQDIFTFNKINESIDSSINLAIKTTDKMTITKKEVVEDLRASIKNVIDENLSVLSDKEKEIKDNIDKYFDAKKEYWKV